MRVLARLSAPRTWSWLRALIDVIVLYVAASLMLFGNRAVQIDTTDRWVAVLFPLIVLVLLHQRGGRSSRLSGAMSEAAGHVLGVVSLAAMLTIAL